ncbi:type VII toxin-antitoxin system HepT family RNase toxin [Methylomonas koyamae]|uniref:type VII toxin-antitoxin system HepT family RNase toxin n=1 Tax=Methylomonas koyamae TaxID=702114 RepID=UPI002872F6C6|nr:DUF86 domain-containing protein [Methylomonas koyamae]WNB74514.1 DUF86 domain-containing protein [Methylomonas koyamae]
MRDIAYEQALMRHRRKMLRILDDYSQENANSWTERDFLAIQRALQVFIESFIGMARYFVEQKYQLSVSQSREALDELKSRGVLTSEQHGELMKIIGFRNVLVHDYLDVNDGIVQAIVTKKQYLILEEWMVVWRGELDECEPECPNGNK